MKNSLEYIQPTRAHVTSPGYHPSTQISRHQSIVTQNPNIHNTYNYFWIIPTHPMTESMQGTVVHSLSIKIKQYSSSSRIIIAFAQPTIVVGWRFTRLQRCFFFGPIYWVQTGLYLGLTPRIGIQNWKSNPKWKREHNSVCARYGRTGTDFHIVHCRWLTYPEENFW